MTRMVGRPGASFERLLLVSALLWISVDSPRVVEAEEFALPYGRWSTESRGFGWPCRLEAIEVRESSRAGEALLVGFERGEDGRLRLWGSSRIDRAATGPLAARWFAASWASRSGTTSIRIRPEPTGRLLAIVRERSQDPGIGELVRQLILAPAADAPATKTAISARFEGNTTSAKVSLSGVFVANSEGGGARPVALPEGFATAEHPCWSPDGRWVAFAGFDGAGRDPLIRVAPAEGGPSTAVAAGTTPTWSADGSKIAYVATGRAEFATNWSSLGRNDERIEAVTLSGPDAGAVEILARGIWPRWAPEDGRLAFVGRADANWDVYVRSADGSGVARLTDDPALDTEPVWAAGGRSIVFLSDRGNRWDLYRVKPDAGARADRLTDHVRREDNPSLSPDGRYVAFVDGRGRPQGSILILDLMRGTVRKFPERSDGDRDPAWSPDGRSIAFVSRRPGPLVQTGGRRP